MLFVVSITFSVECMALIIWLFFSLFASLCLVVALCAKIYLPRSNQLIAISISVPDTMTLVIAQSLKVACKPTIKYPTAFQGGGGGWGEGGVA